MIDVLIGKFEGAPEEMFGQILGLAEGHDGQVYIYDGSGPVIRRYSADGSYLGTIGRPGAGPGEYSMSDGGMAILSNGNLILRDPGNGRFTVYAPDGAFIKNLPYRRGSITSAPVIPAEDGGFFTSTVSLRGTDQSVISYDSAALVRDTLRVPSAAPPAPMLSATGSDGVGNALIGVPFMPTQVTAITSRGEIITGVGDRYQIDRIAPDGSVLRIVREGVEAVPVSAAEREVEEERVTLAMREMDPAWRWNGPGIPSTKPFFSRLFSGEDGRLWVMVHAPGVEAPVDPSVPAASGTTTPKIPEPALFDVFGQNGRFLGRVRTPKGFSTFPQPVFAGDYAWAIVRDELDVQYLAKLRLVTQPAGER